MEGITEYRLANGLHGAAVPRRVEADDHGQRHVPRRRRARELRRDRDGAPARAPRVQGHAHVAATSCRSWAAAACASTARTGWDRTNYFETFTASQRQPRLGAVDGSRPDGEFVHPQERPRLRDDRRAQRVRERREQSRSSVLFGKMLSTAYQWHNYGHVPIGARSDIENVDIGRLQAFYKTVLPAGQRRADRRRQVRRGPDARADRQVLRPDSQARAHAARASTRRSRCRTASARATLRRVGNSKFLGMMFHTVRGAHPDAVAIDVLGDVMTLAPSGRLYKSLVETKKATSVDADGMTRRRSRHDDVLRADTGWASRSSRRAKPCSRRSRTSRRSRSPKPKSRACARRPPSTSTTCSPIRRRSAWPFPNPSRSATGGCSSFSATAIAP